MAPVDSSAPEMNLAIDTPPAVPISVPDPSTPPAPITPPPVVPPVVVPFVAPNKELLAEVRQFNADSHKRYKFNNRWDITLSVLGILLSIAVVAAGFSKNPEVSAVLGAIVGAVITAQKAFPFGQRAAFYRLLIGQSDNLCMRASQGVMDKVAVLNALSSLRMDFAQQLPRGSSSPSTTPGLAPDPNAAPPAAGSGDSQV